MVSIGACTRLIAACGDYKLYLFDTMSGEVIDIIDEGAPVLGAQFSLEGDYFFTICKAFVVSNSSSMLRIYKFTRDGKFKNVASLTDPSMTPDINMTCGVWGPLNETIVVGYSDGSIRLFHVKSGKVLKMINGDDAHTSNINKIQLNKRGDMFITASDDKTAALYNLRTFQKIKTYPYSEIVNTAAISPLKKHILLGGGRASTATTTGKKDTYNAVHFYHTIFENEVGNIKAHFSPINIIAISPDGKSFASGGEDGFVKLFNFDKDYLNMKDDTLSALSKN